MGFEYGQYYICDLQKAVSPSGLGEEWQQREYNSEIGGEQREHDASDLYGGNPPGPINANQRAASTTADCNAMYCAVILGYWAKTYHHEVALADNSARHRNVFLIDQTDPARLSNFLTLYNLIVTSKGCCPLNPVSCDYCGSMSGDISFDLTVDPNAPVDPPVPPPVP